MYTAKQMPHLPQLPGNIPSTPDKLYKQYKHGKKWLGWGPFLGISRISNQEKSKNKRPYQSAKKFVQTLKLTTVKDWLAYINGKMSHLPPLPSNIPRKPDDVYLGEWKGWPTFFGLFSKQRFLVYLLSRSYN